MGPVGDEVHVRALRVDVSGSAQAGDAGLIAVLLTVLEGDESIQVIVLIDHVIPAEHGLVVKVFAGAVGVDEVRSEPGGVGRGIIRNNFLADGADAAGGNHVARKQVADVGTGAGTADVHFILAGAAGKGIGEGHVVFGKMLAVAQIHGRSAGDHRERNALAKALEAEEDEIFVLANGAAEGSAELVGDVLAAGRADLIVLGIVGVEDRVAHELE